MKRLMLLLLAAAGVSALSAADSLKVGEFTFTPTGEWKVAEQTRPMSQGSLVLPVDGGQVEAIFFHFGTGQGGDLEGNVRRWTGMFESDPLPKVEREEFEFGGKKAPLITITGTYKGSSFRPEPQPKEGHTLIAAVLPSSQGDVFVRLVAPQAQAAAARDDLVKLLQSAAK